MTAIVNNIVYRGTLTREKLEELAKEHLGSGDIRKYDPSKNPQAISIIKQPDGNWKGWMQKNGKTIEVREVGPETVLQRLLTHG